MELGVAMRITAKEFAKKHGVSQSYVRKWYNKGYLGNATKINNRIYSIEEDTPRPYPTNEKVKKKNILWGEIIDAANNQNSIFPQMYPNLQPGTLDREIDSLISKGIIQKRPTKSGVDFIDLDLEGHKYLPDFDPKKDKDKLKEVLDLVYKGIELTQALATVFVTLSPYVIPPTT